MLTPADAFRSIDCTICVMLYRHVEDMPSSNSKMSEMPKMPIMTCTVVELMVISSLFSGPRMHPLPTGATTEAVVTGLVGALPLLADVDLLLTAETMDAVDPARPVVEVEMMVADEGLLALLPDELVHLPLETVTMLVIQQMLPRTEKLRDLALVDTEMSRALLLPMASVEKAPLVQLNKS